MNQQRFEEGTQTLLQRLAAGKARLDTALAGDLGEPTFSLDGLTERELVFLAYGIGYGDPHCRCVRCSIRRKAIEAIAGQVPT